MPGFQSTRLATEGALEPFFFLYTDDSIQGNPETCKQSSITLNYEVKNIYRSLLNEASHFINYCSEFFIIFEKNKESVFLQTATFCGQQGRISRTVRAILSGQPGISAGQRVLRPTDQY